MLLVMIIKLKPSGTDEASHSHVSGLQTEPGAPGACQEYTLYKANTSWGYQSPA